MSPHPFPYQDLKSREDLAAFYFYQDVPIIEMKLVPRTLWEKVSLLFRCYREKDLPELTGSACVVKIPSPWGETYLHFQQGKKVEEINLWKGQIHRYWSKAGGERRVEYDPRNSTNFPYRFQE